LRPPNEFFDHNRISRPADLNQAVSVRCFFPSIAGRLTDFENLRNSAYRTIPATSLVLGLFRLPSSFIPRIQDDSLIVFLLQETMGSLSPCWLSTHCECSHYFRRSQLTHFTPHVVFLLSVVRFRITNPLLLISLGFLIGGFTAINRWGE
jgi:hypothetical protein